MDARTTTVAIPATAHKGFGRDADWIVSMLDGAMPAGTGSSLAQARVNATTTTEDILRNAATGPAFALDDDGGVVVAVPWGTGSMTYKVSEGRARLISSCVHAPQDALNAHHYTRLPTS